MTSVVRDEPDQAEARLVENKPLESDRFGSVLAYDRPL